MNSFPCRGLHGTEVVPCSSGERDLPSRQSGLRKIAPELSKGLGKLGPTLLTFPLHLLNSLPTPHNPEMLCRVGRSDVLQMGMEGSEELLSDGVTTRQDRRGPPVVRKVGTTNPAPRRMMLSLR